MYSSNDINHCQLLWKSVGKAERLEILRPEVGEFNIRLKRLGRGEDHLFQACQRNDRTAKPAEFTRLDVALLLPERILGSINQTALREMLGSQTMRNFKAARPMFCHGCRLEQKCQGNCKAAAEVCYGDLCACEPFLQTFIGQARKP